MTREEKIKKKKDRAKKRKEKKWNRYINRINHARDGNYPMFVPLSAIKCGGGHWQDSNSPTGYSQVCDYVGICQFPCIGDC